MTITLEAVYENGVFRPTQPISLAEGTRVEVVVTANEPGSQPRSPAEILAEIAALPIEGGGEEFSGRDHDRILYGKKGAR